MTNQPMRMQAVHCPEILRIVRAACVVAVLMIALLCVSFSSEAHAEPIPRLEHANGVTQLYVNDQPFLALAGELGNSTAGDIGTANWALEKCASMNMNTVLVPVYWDRTEPQEGTFDFSLVQGAIESARAHELRLVLLWFGTWKNSMSSYTPSWVKRDTERFQRIIKSDGGTEEIITPASVEARDADARAFALLMRWLKDFDSDYRTVIMVQVENEIGMIPEPLDRSGLSDQQYRSAVPDELIERISNRELGDEIDRVWRDAGSRTEGSWEEVFGGTPEGQEVLSAWQFARYVQHVAAAGKAEYDLPMYVNAALIRPGYRPGNYPAGGPLPHLIELWQAAAPAIDMISPDIYFPNFMDWSARYDRSSNPIFIPEMAPSMRASANALFAIAELNAIGTAPFAVENLDGDKARLLGECYGRLAHMHALVLGAQQEGTMIGLAPDVGFDWNTPDEPVRARLGDFIFEARFDRQAGGSLDVSELPTLGTGRWEAPPNAPLGSAMIIQLGPEEFVVVGMGVRITFEPADGEGTVGIDWTREGRYENGGWVGKRWLNGDETHQGRHLHLYEGQWRAQRFRLYRY